MTLASIAHYLRTTSGLNEASLGSGVLERAVRRRQLETQTPTIDAYHSLLLASPEELQALLDDVTVPETSFFRDPGVFSALTEAIVADWLARPALRTLRILSAPCSTGEEPYSIAMALLDAGLPADRFSIDAIDINSRVLATARRAVYGNGAFRGRDLAFRERYFHRAAHGWELNTQVRECVRFRHGNLLDPQLASHTYDVVFCRNLLIYFDPPTQAQAMVRLDALVANGGLLFLGPAETFLTRHTAFESLGRPMSFGFRKTEARTAVRTPNPPATPRAPRRDRSVVHAPAANPQPRTSAHVAPAAPIARDEAPSVDALFDRAETLANDGRLREAAELCRACIEREGPSVRGYFLLGVVADALGDGEQALSYFRKVIYLQPGHEQALLHLALLKRQRGEVERANHFERRARSVGRRDGEA